MNAKNYLMVNKQTNVVDNICLWDGDIKTWQPPSNYLMLVKESTQAKIWALNTEKTDFELTIEIGAGEIGFLFDGSFVITNNDKPLPPVVEQPVEVTE